MSASAKLIFCTNNEPQDIVLRLGTMFKYSHVGIITPQRTVIHATTPRVREDSLADFCVRFPSYEVRAYAVDDIETGLFWLRRQVGKPYDITAILGFICHHDWNDPNKWFCSELAAAFLEKCGSPRFRAEDVQSVWPQTIYVVR